MAHALGRFAIMVVVVLIPATAFSDVLWPSPELWAAVGGSDATTLPVTISLNRDGKTFKGATPQIRSDEFAFSGSFRFDPDPFVSYSLGVTNFTAAPLNFSFLFLTPVVGGPYNFFKSQHVSVVTDGGAVPDGVVTAAPFGGANVHRPQIDGVEALFGHLGDGCSVGALSHTCDKGKVSLTISPISPALLGVLVEFTLSAGDLYSTSGRVELTSRTRTAQVSAVPEPTTLGLLGLGMAIGVVRRLKRR